MEIHVYATDVLKIPGQKEKLLKALEDSQSKAHNIFKEDPLLIKMLYLKLNILNL